jgi:2-polyprenyl-3-methyl-5-hydroxy-6-metoxy-1,4-benzoquinol methylase
MLQKNKLGFYEISNKPTADELSSYYQDRYYQEARGSYELSYAAAEIDHINARLSRINYLVNQNLSGEHCRSFLDVGCGEGFALAYFAEKNFEVSGLDFSNEGVSRQNPDFAERVETGDLFSLLRKISLSGNQYDVILLQNVLEHVLDPVALLKSIKELLEPAGLVIITVPNDFSLTQKTLLAKGHIDREFWVCPPDHLSYFDHNSLRNILLHCDFFVRDLISDFPVDWYLFHSGSNYINDPSQGKEAHLSRVAIENMLQANDISDVVSFYRSLAKLGAGRDLTAVASLLDLP